MPEPVQRFHADQPSRGVFGFFRDIGVRETIESIIVAIVLALMFRAYEAEAFIIPTGSMAPSLQGQHMDLECDNCKLRYRSSASHESSIDQQPDTVISTYCPICQFQTRMRESAPDHVSNNGDRILVNKFIYDFQDPERYDVIVFKNPNNGKQNYIKRLIGLPGDNILIENGDIYLMIDQGNGKYKKQITRKPPRKLRNVLQAVDDTNHIGKSLKSVDWPSRWQSFDGKGNWTMQERNEHPCFSTTATDDPNWIRYRHFQPLKEEWPTIESGITPSRFKDGAMPLGRLIGDQYGYNDSLYRGKADVLGQPKREYYQNLGLHWVGDIGLECWTEVRSEQGMLLLDVVEGGAHFVCEIDIATGMATLRCNDDAVETKVTFQNSAGESVDSPTGQTNLKGAGKYHIEYVNADDRINLWINNKLIEFDAAEYIRTGIPVPTYSAVDAGDAEPVGIAAQGADLSVTRIKVLRDIYYTSVKGYNQGNIANETNENNIDRIEFYQRNPESWNGPQAVSFFKKKKGQTEPMFRLEDSDNSAQDQFLPMGDNSPRSMDGRVWPGPNFVERDLLIGRAMLVYWPHTLNKPIKYFPNFGRMGFIR